MRSSCAIITINKSTIALSLLDSAVGVMKITMLNHFTIRTHMLSSKRDSPCRF